GKILENIGICSQVSFVRHMQGRKTLGVDPKLFIKDLWFENVPVRIYQPKVPSASQRRGVMFFHGGGWVFGSLETHEKLCRSIARESESVVVSVGYRLAPEHKYPAAYEDCLNATIHFMKNIEHYGVDPARIIICGDSAGGNLAAAVSQTLAGRSDLPRLRAQILIYPGLQALDFNLPSEDAIIQQLPESFILTCEYDVLRDDGLLYKKRLEDNGVRVTWYHLEDGFHGIINSFKSDWLSFSSGK
ncbi:ADCL4 protein, partial [Thalassarche chlororhynchos]|nr:ADCL4 protein [Thalassarche chlororhynchos]